MMIDRAKAQPLLKKLGTQFDHVSVFNITMWAMEKRPDIDAVIGEHNDMLIDIGIAYILCDEYDMTDDQFLTIAEDALALQQDYGKALGYLTDDSVTPVGQTIIQMIELVY